ncbi:hypothetical protein S40285_06536 [Stachybotrys chlorohalonatus IBT 40285]|uniref:2EXR domain-containing protein n=1 Tax=Stachybotrys chlorohalonatus (strain IBT 40285) TaxID=1283841 RepID=A0A084QEA6_STAC4|nr:hypothetical protein S40285_06536 [Stachybotrys chlorohalonata IBT 40285]
MRQASPTLTDTESRQSAISKFTQLPAELRLRIWSCAVEPQIVILDDLVHKLRAYPLHSATQLNSESRLESRQGYEPVGQGSYFNFSRDILVCDPNISDQYPSKPLENLAPRIQRLVFWDCFPDDGQVDGPHQYSAYLTARYRQEHFGQVEFDKFLFPNLKDLWIIKIGEVDRSWRIGVDQNLPYEVRLRKTARQFRYWIDENIIEIAPLNLDEEDTKAVLKGGRCGKEDCQELNRGRNKMISKIMFMSGQYKQSKDAEEWVRILPWSTKAENDENRMRWIMVERTLTFSLRWEGDDEDEDLAASLLVDPGAS